MIGKTANSDHWTSSENGWRQAIGGEHGDACAGRMLLHGLHPDHGHPVVLHVIRIIHERDDVHASY